MKLFRVLFYLAPVILSNLYAQQDTTIVSVRLIDSTIVQDVRYATPNNFTGKILYPSSNLFLRKVAADSLARANRYLLENYNLQIKMYDGYRPRSVQRLMWAILPDERYVANPDKGSRHNRGAAVDITLIEKTGNELDMGTPYDDFTERAGSYYEGVSNQVKENRKILRETMIRFGFLPLDSEWWHYDFKDWQKFSIPEE